MVNKVILIGNLGADPEVKYSQGGTAVAKMRLATSERVKQGEEWVDHTEWHTLVAFGTTAENAGKFLAKGRKVYVEGRLRTRSWDGPDGSKRYATEVIVDGLRFLDSGGNGKGQAPAPEAAPAPGTDEVPF